MTSFWGLLPFRLQVLTCWLVQVDSNPFRNSLRTPLVPFSLRENLVGPSGLEPPTSCLSGTRSNHLSYEPIFKHSFSKDLCRFFLLGSSSATGWWRWWDSNPWPPACRAGALPTELHPQIFSGFCCFLQFFKRSFKIEQRTQKTLLSRLATNIVFVCADSP